MILRADLTEADCQFLVSALRTAADKYHECAAQCMLMVENGGGVAYMRIAKQFEQQERTARQYADRFEDGV